MLSLHGFGPLLLEGAGVTLRVTLTCTVLGLVIGLVGAAMKLSRFWPLRLAADVYVTVVRGFPALVLILLTYFGGVTLVNQIARAMGHTRYVDVDAFTAGTVALGMIFGAYATEVFRGAILAIPKGEIEAAHAFAMWSWLTFRRIILPQLWRFALPGLGNVFLVIMKETALVSVIGLEELMRKTEIAVGYTKQPFTFYLAAALVYLTMTLVTMIVLQRLECRANRGVRTGDGT